MRHVRGVAVGLAIAWAAAVRAALADAEPGCVRRTRGVERQWESPGVTALEASAASCGDVITFTILHTNDFHGYLEPDMYGRGGSASMATAIDDIRTSEGAQNVLLMDAGDVYLGAAPVSQLLLGESAIDIYNMLGYDVAAFGNHEFDKGQTVLVSRTLESDFPWIGANIVISGTEWTTPWWCRPYVTLTVGVSGAQATLGVIGLDTDETPQITLKGSTEGLVFKDLTETTIYYYDEVRAQSDALVVLAHMGTDDAGAYKGLQTVARELIDAGKPVDLMIGGHQHQPMFQPVMIGETAIVEAGFHGRWLGRADVSVDPATKELWVVGYKLMSINDDIVPDAEVEARVAYWAERVAPIIEQLVGTTYVSLGRNYNAESAVGNLVTDGMRWKADRYDDGEANDSVEIAFTNPGGLRADIRIPAGATLPYTITWGDTFEVMPFGNTLYLMDLTGAQIQELLDHAATLESGMLQTSGATWYWYNDCNCDTPMNSWGGGMTIGGELLDVERNYRVVTNDYLAAGSSGWAAFGAGVNRWNTQYDMQEAVNEYVTTISPIEPGDVSGGRITRLDTPPPDLSSSRKRVEDADGDGWAEAGETLIYTITITNGGGTGAGLVLTDTLPSVLSYVEGSLSYDLPATGFAATVTEGVLIAHTEGWLRPPTGSSLPEGGVVTITFSARVTDSISVGCPISNSVELRDQLTVYAIPPAVILSWPAYPVFVSLVVSSHTAP